MGNRSGCSLFSEGGGTGGDSSRLRSSDDRLFWLDGLTQDENKFIKDLYTDLNLSCNRLIIFNWHYRQRNYYSGTKERTRALNGVYAEEKTSHQEIVGGI